MTKKKIFDYEESSANNGFYFITIKHDDFFLESTEGSYNVICARLLNISYADYLRFCRDILGATLIGKNSIYVIPYFKKGENLFQLIKLLNGLANTVLFERANPDYENHQKEVEEYQSHLREVRNKNVSN